MNNNSVKEGKERIIVGKAMELYSGDQMGI